MKTTARFYALLAAGALCLPLAACLPDAPPPAAEDGFYLRATTYDTLAGWAADDTAAALTALRLSCARIERRAADAVFSAAAPWAGQTGAWQDACAALPAEDADAETARAYFETHFTPYEIWADAALPQSREGLFTGYYEPLLRAVPPDAAAENAAAVPLYARPDDLVSVNLGDFRPDLKGETLWGRVTDGRLVPYHTRAEIESGAALPVEKEIVRVDNAVDAFFLHIQGSGIVEMPDGSNVRVGYAAQNGHPYFAIGRALIDRGVLTRETVSMQSIRAWLEQNPDDAAAVMNLNPSFIFFHVLEQAGSLGAEGVVLTAGRSLAIDRRRLPYGAPVYIDAEEPDGGPRLQRLMVAQDTGGAIRGAVRGDFFWGAGDTAAQKAGAMKSRGYAWLLMPKTVVPDETVVWRAPAAKPWHMRALDVLKATVKNLCG